MSKTIPPPPPVRTMRTYSPTDPVKAVPTRRAFTVKRTGKPGVHRSQSERVNVKSLMRSEGVGL